MIELAAWVVFPLVMLAVCLGTGLLAERLAGLHLEPALVPPLGLCASLVLIGPVFALGAGAGVAGAVLGVAAVAGVVVGARTRFRPRLGALAGLAAYALHIAPVALTGTATFLGYNLLNDTAIHLALVDYLADHGARLVELPPSSYAAAIEEYVGRNYPLGSHELLAALGLLVPHDPAELYQPFLAVSMGMAAAAVFALLRGTGRSARMAAGAAFLACAGQLVFSFGLQGSIKELPLVAVLATAAALAPSAVGGERRAGAAALIGIAGAALYTIYGLYALAWIAPLAVVVALAARSVRVVATGVAAFAAGAAVHFAPSVDYYSHHAVLEDAAELGPLGGPLNPLQASGVWLNGDYRFEPETLPVITFALAAFVLAGAVYGALVALRRREWAPIAFAAPALGAWAVGAVRGSPYANAKVLAILSVPLLLLAVAGWAAVRPQRARQVALAILACAVLASDALAYRIALPAPRERLEELETLSERLGERGPVLLNEFEEYAKHFGREGQLSDPYERWNARPLEPRAGVRRRLDRGYSLDELEPGFVQAHRALVTRRSPAEDRPPPNYVQVFRGRFYDAWERRGPAPSEHVPFGSRFSAAGFTHCGPLERRLGSGEFTGAVRPAAQEFDISKQRPLPPGWYAAARRPGQLETTKGGSVFAEAITGPGRHEIWIRGRIVRTASVFVDGRLAGRVRAQNRPSQWSYVGAVRLGGGPHRVELRRPKRSLRPGDAARDIVGPITAVPAVPARLVRTSDPRRLCGQPLDWVSRTGPSG